MRSGLTAVVCAAVLALGAAPALADPAMWEVSDADSHIWLFGSMHALPEGTQWRTPQLDSALAASGQVYFETDIGPLGVIALTIKMVTLAFDSARHPWVDQLTPAQMAQLKTAIEPLGISFEEATLYPPWVIQLRLEQESANPENDKLDFASGVEPVLQWELPKERKTFLETPGQQFDLLAGDPIDVQIERLFAALDAADGGDNGALFAAWRDGDVDTIATTIVDELAGDAEYGDKLLFDRNRAWIPALEGLLANNDEDLVVVGAAHLAGTGSVLDLLAQAGYTVKRVQ